MTKDTGSTQQPGTCLPVTYVELNTPNLNESVAFFTAVFGWSPQPFAAPDYLVAPHGDGAGFDTALLSSRDGQPRAVAVIRVPDLDACLETIKKNGGAVVVAPFSIGGVGRGAYVTDPAGLLLGLHMYDPNDS